MLRSVLSQPCSATPGNLYHLVLWDTQLVLHLASTERAFWALIRTGIRMTAQVHVVASLTPGPLPMLMMVVQIAGAGRPRRHGRMRQRDY
jgi:hypothetical protein